MSNDKDQMIQKTTQSMNLIYSPQVSAKIHGHESELEQFRRFREAKRKKLIHSKHTAH
jgi:regulatory protein YycH of two-component signal transduction system YycFG